MLEHRPRRVYRLRSHTRALPSRAMDDLRFIRETMERSSAFTAVPGWGMVAMGITALCAAWLTSVSHHLKPASWLTVWLSEAAIAMTIGMIATCKKAQQAGVPLTSGPARKFMYSFLPAAIAGGVLTAVLYRLDLAGLLPGAWLLLYGVAVTSAGSFSVSVLPLMGGGFMLLGIVSFLTPPGLHTTLLSLGFGGLHIGFGFWIARRHGG
jgi:hypothetical protein